MQIIHMLYEVWIIMEGMDYVHVKLKINSISVRIVDRDNVVIVLSYYKKHL